jgi:hypothetical protein
LGVLSDFELRNSDFADCTPDCWLFDKDIGVKALFSNRRAWWRATVFGGTTSLLVLAGCAGRSRDTLSRWLHKNDDQKVAARDPFLDSEIDRIADAHAARRRAERQQSGLSERFDRNRVASVGQARSRQLAAAGPPGFPEVNAASRPGETHPDPPGDWRPGSHRGAGGDPFAAIERRGGARTAVYEQPAQPSGPPPRNPFQTAESSRPRRLSPADETAGVGDSKSAAAPFPTFPVIQAANRHAAPRKPGHADGHRRAPEAGPQEPELQIVADSSPPADLPKPARPAEPRHAAESKGTVGSNIVNVSATRPAASVTKSVLDSESRMVWRAVATLPTPIAAKAPLPPAKPAAPAASAKEAPPREPPALPKEPPPASTAALPFPPVGEDASRTEQSPAPAAKPAVAAKDDAGAESIAESASPMPLLRWLIYGAAGLATIVFFLRRRRRAAASAAGR